MSAPRAPGAPRHGPAVAAAALALLAALAMVALLAPTAGATGWPGPDALPYAYRGQDSLGTGVGDPIPTPSFASISGGADTEDVLGFTTAAPLEENTWSTCKAIGFAFRYYGTDYDCVYINSVGLLALDDLATTTGPPSGPDDYLKPVALASGGAVPGMIAPFWVHTYGADPNCLTSPDDGIHTLPGDATATPPEPFVVEFRNIPLHEESTAGSAACANGNILNNPQPQYITWQARFWPTTMTDLRQGAIDFHLYDVQAPPPANCGAAASCSAAIGIARQDGMDGILYDFGTSSLNAPPQTPTQYGHQNLHVRIWPNHAPSYAVVTPPAILEDTASATNIVFQSSPDLDGDAVQCTVLAPPAASTGTMGGPFSPISGTCTHGYIPAANYCNSHATGVPLDVPYTTADALGASPPPPPSEGHTAIIVTCVNDVPSMIPGPSVPAVPVGQAVSIAGWATGIVPGPPSATDEASQTITINLLPGIPAGAFSDGPRLTSAGTLEYTGAIAGQYMACFQEMDSGAAPTMAEPWHINVNPSSACVQLEIQALGPNGSTCAQLSPDFFVGGNALYAGQTLSFMDQSQGPVQTHNWEFGDGYTSNAPGPTHTYGSPADYTVRMTVYDQAGCSAFVSKLLHIVEPPESSPSLDPATGEPIVVGDDGGLQPPSVEAGPDQEVREGSPVRFGAVAQGARLDQVEYRWRQTSGAPVILRHPTTATPEFDAPRLADPDQPAYLIFAVKVSTPQGESPEDFIQVTITASNHKPVANAGLDVEVARGGSAMLGSKSLDPDNDSLTYYWKVAAGPAIPELPSEQPSLRITVPADAVESYVDIQLTVADAVSSSSDTVRVWIREPVSSGPGGFRSTPLKDGSVRFDAGVVATEYVWDFGDDSGLLRTSDTSVVHRYAESRTYNVTLHLGGTGQPVTQAVTPTVPEGAAVTPVGDRGMGWEIVVAVVSAIGAALLVGGLLSWSLRQRRAP